MARRNIDVYFDMQRSLLLTSTGSNITDVQLPRIYYQEKPLLRVTFVSGNVSTPYTGFDTGQTFSAAIATDWLHETAPVCRSSHSDINVVGDWGDASITGGKFSVRIDANTSEYATMVNGVQYKSAWFEFKAFDTDGDLQVSALFSLNAYNLLDPTSSPDPNVSENFGPYDSRYVGRNFSGANYRTSPDGKALQLWDADMAQWRSLLITGGTLGLSVTGED